MAKTKRVIRITAGRLVSIVEYNQAMPYDPPEVRAKKSKHSSLARQKINYRLCYQTCQLFLAANFYRGDLYVTLPYSDDWLPMTRKAANALLAKFIKNLRLARKLTGDTLTYIYSTHELTGDGGRRYHHHLVINAGAERGDYETIKSLWPYGDNVEISKICDTEHYRHDDFLELAMYLTREKNPDAPLTAVGARGWTGSRNLKKPVRHTELVDENLTITIPPNAFIIESEEKVNEFGAFKYIRYLLPEPPGPTKAPRPQKKE